VKSRLLIAIVAGLLAPVAAVAAPPAPATIPVSEIKPGMTGYGLTVFRGFKVERFNVKVIDVLHNFMPKQDLILAHVDHPVLKRTGIIGGMSGSPIYFNGKLAGALAYGWRFSKDPVAGITPIADMIRLMDRKPRKKSAAAARAAHRARRTLDRMALRSLSRRDRWWRPPGLLTAPRPESQLEPVAVPMSAAGFSRQAMDLLRDGFSRFGFEPVQGAGTGKAEGPRGFEPGGALGVQLASGDITLVSTGTVTMVQGDRVLGFGHRMLNAGEIYLPTTTAKIAHCLASLSRSFKISRPARAIGSLTQDRQAGILADTTGTAPTVPMTLRLTTLGGEDSLYKLRLANHRLLTPNLVRSVVASAIGEALADVDHATFTINTRLELKGRKPFVLTEHHYSKGGIRLPVALRSRGLKAVGRVLDNPFEPVKLQRIDVQVKTRFARELVQISGLSVANNRVEPGARINVKVDYRPHGGKEFSRTYPLTVPADLDGSVIKLQAAAGNTVRRIQATPEDLTGYLESLRGDFGARTLVLSLSVPGKGLKVRGQVIRSLPDSVLDSLNTGTGARAGATFKQVQHNTYKSDRVLSGKQTLRLRVHRENP